MLRQSQGQSWKGKPSSDAFSAYSSPSQGNQVVQAVPFGHVWPMYRETWEKTGAKGQVEIVEMKACQLLAAMGRWRLLRLSEAKGCYLESLSPSEWRSSGPGAESAKSHRSECFQGLLGERLSSLAGPLGHHGVMMAAQQNDAAPEACAGVSLQVLGVSVHGRGMEDGFLLPMDARC